VAAFALLGYNPFNTPSRSVIEAVGSGYDYKNGELVLCSNFVNIKGGLVSGTRLSRLSDSQGAEVEQLINEGISLNAPFTFKFLNSFRGLLIIHEKLSSNVTNTHPGYVRDRVGEELSCLSKRFSDDKIKVCKPLSANAQRTAKLINDFTKQVNEVLSQVNIVDKWGVRVNNVLLSDAGNSLPLLESLKDYKGVKASMVADSSLELGVAKLLGLSVINRAKDLSKMPKVIVNSLASHDGVYFNIKGPDKYGHLGDSFKKVKEIERVDHEFIKPLLDLINLDEFVICLAPSHATPACFGIHTSDPVPYLITNGKEVTGNFCEKTVNKSFIEGKELIDKVIS
jgi:2,3-diphosphopglycerate-independent phosphoglycerate mutase